MEAILVAVAVHDDREARLERALPQRIRVQAGEALTFRISYRLADNPGRREEATVTGELRLAARAPVRGETAMHDRPLLNDARAGNILFQAEPLEPGIHQAKFHVELRTSDRDMGRGHDTILQEKHLDVAFEIEAL